MEPWSHPWAEFTKIYTDTVIRKHRGSLKKQGTRIAFFGQKNARTQLRNVQNIISQPSSNLLKLLEHGQTSSL